MRVLLSLLCFVCASFATPPCFGDIGQSTRGFDIGYRSSSGPFSSTHLSRWNYTIPRMRYDVFQHDLTNNDFFESNNLFDFSNKIMYSWDMNQVCKRCPQPKFIKECIPQDWKVQDVIFVAGQKCQVYVDDMENKRNAQGKREIFTLIFSFFLLFIIKVATALPFGTTPWLVNVLSYDQYENVIEAVQIQNFKQGTYDDPHALDIPSFCANVTTCSSLQEHLEEFKLPVYIKRRLGY